MTVLLKHMKLTYGHGMNRRVQDAFELVEEGHNGLVDAVDSLCRRVSAVEARLDRESGTCHDIGDRGDFRCSLCLCEWADANNHDFYYCPSCGARVIRDEEEVELQWPN